MALGIKKITETVVDDNRSLVMLGSYTYDKQQNIDEIEFEDNNAVPDGAVLASPNGTLRIKTGLREQRRVDANSTIELESITNQLMAIDSISTKNIINQNVTTDKIKDLNVTTVKINNYAVTAEKIADGAVTSSKIANYAVQNIHLNSVNAPDEERSVNSHNIRDGAITNNKLANGAITNNKISNNQITINKLDKELQDKIVNMDIEINTLNQKIIEIQTIVNNNLSNLDSSIKNLINELETRIRNLENKFTNNKLENAVVHNGTSSIGQKYTGSTALTNIHCTGDIEGKRVYFMTYQDLAEAYEPGEYLEPGDIVAVHEDGLVYKAESTDVCIVGVISDEFANCLGATKDELISGKKVAVGMIGKVHVKIKGPVKLGQQINISLSDAGVGYGSNVGIGKALETIDCGFDEIHKVLVQIRPM